MPPVDHHTSIEIKQELLKAIGDPHPQQHAIIHKAHCTCGWKGPRRARAWEATDDAERHVEHPDI